MNFVPDLSNIKLSLILIIMICAIVFFVYLRKERFHNVSDIMNMDKTEIRSKLQRVKSCIEDQESCDAETREDIVKELDTLISLSEMF